MNLQNETSLIAEPLIKMQGICLKREGRPVLDDINLDVNRGDFIAITGPNGGGKTTLLRIMLRLLTPDKGQVVYTDRGGKLSIGYLPQNNMIDSHFPISVREVVESGLIRSPQFSAEEKTLRVSEMLKLVGMDNAAERPIGALSGGQLQRTLLGRAMVSDPQLLVLDEPLSYLDRHFEDEFYRIIKEAATSATIVLVSHQMTAIAAMASRHFIVDHTLHQCSAHHHFFRSDCR